MQNSETLIKLVARKIHECGGSTYYVGGYVRDQLLGVESHDYDLEVHGISVELLERILSDCAEYVTIGKSFGIFSLKGHSIDISMPRKETAIGCGHRDFSVIVDPNLSLQNSCKRRDFTINAMMQDVLTGEIFDFYHGQADLNSKIIRHVNSSSFSEDPLRVLRCAQFASRFQFSIAPETMKLCSLMNLSSLSSERVNKELYTALMKSSSPSLFFRTLAQFHQLSFWFPELEQLQSIPQPPEYHSEGNVFEHTLLVLDEAAKRKKSVSLPYGFMLLALTHDFGKALTTEIIGERIRSIGHEQAGIPLIHKFLNRVVHDNQIKEYLDNMVPLHMRPNILAAQNASIKATNKLFDQAISAFDLVEFSLCDHFGRILMSSRPSPEPYLRERLLVYNNLISLPEVTGKDLIEAGLKPGESFSDFLSFTHRLHLSGVPKDQALKQLIANIKKH